MQCLQSGAVPAPDRTGQRRHLGSSPTPRRSAQALLPVHGAVGQPGSAGPCYMHAESRMLATRAPPAPGATSAGRRSRSYATGSPCATAVPCAHAGRPRALEGSEVAGAHGLREREVGRQRRRQALRGQLRVLRHLAQQQPHQRQPLGRRQPEPERARGRLRRHGHTRAHRQVRVGSDSTLSAPK